MACAGSLHGYNILDQNRLYPEIGSEEEYEALAGELRRWDMGQILDIVPNQMCIEGQEIALWMDVLENGPGSSCAIELARDYDASYYIDRLLPVSTLIL